MNSHDFRGGRIWVVLLLFGIFVIVAAVPEAYSWTGETWGTINRGEIVRRAGLMIDMTWSPNRGIYNYAYPAEIYTTFNSYTDYSGLAYSQNNPQENWSEFTALMDGVAFTAGTDLRVSASSLNMREGPGTSFGVVTTLSQGNVGEIRSDFSNGTKPDGSDFYWYHTEFGTQTGWCAAYSSTVDYLIYDDTSVYEPGIGNDCSGFASICWKLPARYTTTSFETEANGSQTRFFAMSDTGTSQNVGMVQGDACNDAGNHIILFNRELGSGQMESMEQTPPTARLRTWNWSSLSGYQPLRRKLLTETVDEGFDGFDTGIRPAGWTFTDCSLNSDTYTAVGNYGAASPSIKLDATGDVIETNAFTDPDWLRFWVKGQGTMGTASLLVEEYYSANWHTLSDLTTLPTIGTIIGDISLDSSATRLKFTFSRGTADLAFDDLYLSGTDKTPTPVTTPTPPTVATPTPSSSSTPTLTPVTPTPYPTAEVPTPTLPPSPIPSPTPTSSIAPVLTPTPEGYKTPTPPPTPVENEESLTICTTNIMAFKYRYGDPAARIFQGLEPDIVSAQEFSVQSTYSGVREWVDSAFGTDFYYYFEDAGAANGIISRWTISTAGTWEDVGHESLGRNFAWAVIDIPGEKDLQIVSVHLKAGSTTSDKLIREDQAGQLKDYMQSSFDMQSHYAVLAGDLNAYSRETGSEPCLAVFSTYLDYNDYIPMDREGNSNTNSTGPPRTNPYDWIMPNTLLDDRHITTNVGQAYTSFQAFTAGHVFDTHVFVPLSAVPPILYDDLYYEGITHRPVSKSYHVDDSRDIVLDEGFDGFDTGTRPSGWIFTGCGADSDTYTQSGYYGRSSPSIKLSTDGDQITTPILFDATSLQFWMRGSATDDTTSLLIEDHYDGEWYPLGEFTYLPNSNEGVTVGPLNLYKPTDRIRFTLNKTLGNIAIDDIIIRGVPSDLTPTPVGFHTPSPSPTASVTPSATPTPVGFMTPTPTPSLPPTPSPTMTPSPTVSPTTTPVPTASPAAPSPTPPNLTLEYATYLGGTDRDLARGIDVNGGYAYVTGYTKSTNFPVVGAYQSSNAQNGKYDVWISKLSSNGSSLVYSTYLGGSGNEYGNNLTVDSSGQAYVVGTTYSYNFPMVSSYQSSRTGSSCAFLTKISSSGSTLIYSTYLGGNDDDYGYGVDVENDTPYLAGYTKSGDFPVVNAYQSTHGGSAGSDNDIFVTRFASTGSTLIYSTYLGGSDDDNGRAVIASGGEIYLAGITSSFDFPTVSAYQPVLGGGSDGFAVKFTSEGSSLLYSSYLGGNDGESAYGIAVDSVGCAYLAGDTFSADFPVVSAYQSTRSGSSDAFITKFASTGATLIYSTFFGGNDLEYCYGVEVEDYKPAIAGSTKSTDFPVVNPYQSTNAGDYDVFIARFDSVGSSLSYSTYLGGTGEDEARGLALAPPMVYLAGYTASSNFPLVNSYQASLGSSPDAFVARLFYPADAPTPTPSPTPTARVITPTPTSSVTPTPRVVTPTPTPVICTRLDEGFDGFDSGTRPGGWIFTGCDQNSDTYTTVGSFGHLSPAIKMDATGDIIETTTFTDGDWLQFWVKGQGTDATSSLLVEEYYSDDSWSMVTDVSSLPTTGSTLGAFNLLTTTTRLRFTYTQSMGDLAFDDLLVSCLTTPTPVPALSPSPTLTPVKTPPPTAPPTATPTNTPRNTPTPTVTPTPSVSPSTSPTPSMTPTVTPTVMLTTPTPTPVICTRLDEGFDGFDTGTRAAGWTFIGCNLDSDTYNTAGNFGYLSPSIKLDSTGDIIETNTFAGGEWLQFWVKGQGTDSSSHLLVEEYYSSWTTVTDIIPLPITGLVFTGLSLNPSTSQLKFTFTQSVGDLAFDDVLVKCYITPTPTPTVAPTATPEPTATPTSTPSATPTPEDLICRWDVDYSTYLGGGSIDGAGSVVVDQSGCAYLAGSTESSNFPIVSAYSGHSVGYDAIVSKFSSSGSVLLYSTCVGGNNVDYGSGLRVDATGNAYLVGKTQSTNFPTIFAYQAELKGGYDAFITKLSSSGSSLVYSTYLGANSYDYGYGIDIDTSLCAYITGFTYSTDFPTINPYQSQKSGYWDSYLTKLSSSGSALIYSTYLGGSSSEGSYGIDVDQAGCPYLIGNTKSNDFPTKNAYQPSFGGGDYDLYVSKFSSTGSELIYSTYLGGSDIDLSEDIVVDSSNSAYLIGCTQSLNFPTLNAYQSRLGGVRDSFAAKLSSIGTSLIFSTYLGGSEWDEGKGVALDSNDNVYLCGYTNSSDFPVKGAYQASFNEGTSDVFLTRLSAAGSELIASTYLGGSGVDQGYGVALGPAGKPHLVGITDSSYFPIKDAYQSSIGGNSDCFLTRFNWICYLSTPTPAPTVSPSPTPEAYRTPTPPPSSTPTPPPTATPTLTPADYQSPTITPVPAPTSSYLVVGWDDYNGDGYTDYALFRDGTWDIMAAQSGLVITSGVIWGDQEGDIPAPGDYDGDGTADIAYYNRFSGRWYVKDTISGEVITSGLKWGYYDDIPIPEDYDGDGTTDYATWAVSGGMGYWHIYGAGIPWQAYGYPGDIPIPGDYDGDGTCDQALVRQSGSYLRWLVREADGGSYNFFWGYSGDTVKALDYNGDGVSDPTLWRDYSGYTTWFIKSIGKVRYGYSTDTPVTGDFDGDGNYELGLFRGTESRWYIYNQSGPNFSERYGENGDIPVVGQSY